MLMLQSFQLDYCALQFGMGKVQKATFNVKIAPDGKDSESRCREYYYLQ